MDPREDTDQPEEQDYPQNYQHFETLEDISDQSVDSKTLLEESLFGKDDEDDAPQGDESQPDYQNEDDELEKRNHLKLQQLVQSKELGKKRKRKSDPTPRSRQKSGRSREEEEESEDDRITGDLGGRGGRKKKEDPKADTQTKLLVVDFIQKMEQASEADALANKQNKPALHKLKILPEVLTNLGKKQLQPLFLENDVLKIIKRWLEPLPDKSLPNLNIRNGLLDCLMRMPIDSYHLKESGLGQIVMFLWKHPHETKPNKKTAQNLIDKWSRPIFGLSASYSDLVEAEDPRPAKTPPMQTRPVSNYIVSDASLDDIEQRIQESPTNGTMYHATIPRSNGLDFTKRPESRVSEEFVRQSPVQKHSKIKKHIQLLRHQSKSRFSPAVKMSIEGRQ